MDPNGLLGDVPERDPKAAKKSAQTDVVSVSETMAPTTPSQPVVPSVQPQADLPPPNQLPEPPPPAGPTSDDEHVVVAMPVRVLVKCMYGMPNDIVELAELDLQIAKSAGQVCDHPDSVAFARGLKH
ncbi:hypothetical protein [Burkholderia anthina]|uniref:hypothetical protein n=1 Tax=Burkholderia anthina TaxID=179879 RepID=UPI001AA03EAF|nr:hypothetical protein [Burkholderia anthina]QTD91765.1 hypothetical protein J4G50_26280 [Burkholderia anthina]